MYCDTSKVFFMDLYLTELVPPVIQNLKGFHIDNKFQMALRSSMNVFLKTLLISW